MASPHSWHSCFDVLYVFRTSGDGIKITYRVDSRVYPLGKVIPYHPVTAFLGAGEGAPGAPFSGSDAYPRLLQ